MSEPKRRGEFELIADIFAPLARGYPLAFGLTDDAAVLRPEPGNDLVVTADALIAGVHFPADERPDWIACKALRTNLSDLAAKGAKPVGYLLTIALPQALSEDWLREFAEGLAGDQSRYGITLVGGDTTATPGPLCLSITAFGTVPTGSMLRRSGARPGDRLFVSGSIGDAALGLRVVQGGWSLDSAADREHLLARYRLPEPRLGLGPRLRGLASASLDVSDGLVADVGHICETSGVAATIRVDAVPLSPAARNALAQDPALLPEILTGGDDYEIAFAVPAGVDLAALADVGIPLTEIGVIEAGSGVRVLEPGGKVLTLARRGYSHR